jgi:phage terminase small subunit
MANKLNDKQRKAIQCVAAGMNHEEAAKESGYSSKQSVQKMLSHVVAKRYLKELREKAEKKAEVATVGHVLSIAERKVMLTDIANYNKRDDPNASRQSIAELNKMDGAYTPQEVNMNFAEKFFTGLDSKQGLHNDTK